MKVRTKGFLRDELINHKSEQFDYISELHDYLWRFIRCEFPDAGGNIIDYLDVVLQQAERRAMENEDHPNNCPCCGSDKIYLTSAIHCSHCAVTTEI